MQMEFGVGLRLRSRQKESNLAQKERWYDSCEARLCLERLGHWDSAVKAEIFIEVSAEGVGQYQIGY